MKNLLILAAACGLSSCASMDAWLVRKTGLDTTGIFTLGLSAKAKGEALKAEYDAIKLPEITATK